MGSEGPGLFSDFGKNDKEILTTGYNSFGYVEAMYNCKNTTIDVKIDTDSNILTALTFDDILPSTKAIASCKLPDYKSGKFEPQYFHEHMQGSLWLWV
nr:mitochondrial outer membrane protein porin 2-like [Ipomoea batatas]